MPRNQGGAPQPKTPEPAEEWPLPQAGLSERARALVPLPGSQRPMSSQDLAPGLRPFSAGSEEQKTPNDDANPAFSLFLH